MAIRRVQFHLSVCCHCQLLAAKQKDDLVIGIVFVASRGAPQIKIDTRRQDRLHVLPPCSHDVASVLRRLIARPPAGRAVHNRAAVCLVDPCCDRADVMSTYLEPKLVPRFGATSDMLEVELRCHVTEPKKKVMQIVAPASAKRQAFQSGQPIEAICLRYSACVSIAEPPFISKRLHIAVRVSMLSKYFLRLIRNIDDRRHHVRRACSNIWHM